MKVENLAAFEPGTVFDADLVIAGGGPAGLMIAREFFGTSIRVLVLESGLLDETPDHAALAEVESIGEPRTEAQKHKRIAFHGASSTIWSNECQPYGVRCRALGGSSHAWAGKSAAFDPIDFRARPWIQNSGWPIEHSSLQPFLNRAIQAMNLSLEQPDVQVSTEDLRSFYWQFSRSRLDHLDVMRFGREFVTFTASNIRVLLNATATQIGLTNDGTRFEFVDVATLEGVKSRVNAKLAVIAASGIENSRLLLASNTVHAAGIGNLHDRVGRYLMDHPGAKVGQFGPEAIAPLMKRFGFRGVRNGGAMHMFMHGLALTPAVQEREELPNAAIYFMGERSPDDPWDALKRLLQRKSPRPFQDSLALIRRADLIVKGAGLKVLASDLTPAPLKDLIVNTAIRYRPNMVAEEFLSGGLPHKLTGFSIDAITEQRPNPDSRVTLSHNTDRHGVPLAKVDWRIDGRDRHGLVRIAQLAHGILPQIGLPQPLLEPWVAEDRAEDSVIIDMAHTLGTTRMSSDPKVGVVDSQCQVHGVHGLYIAGGSIFPTSGHANPTLMILALAIRLADTIKLTLQ